MSIKAAAAALAVCSTCIAFSRPAAAERDVMAQCRVIYEQAKKSGTAQTDMPAIPLGKVAPEKSEAEKKSDPLHGKSWLEFAAACRAYYLSNPAVSKARPARAAPAAKQ